MVASQVALHAPTGGIVPEVAARAHLRWIAPVLDAAWADAGATWDDVDDLARLVPEYVTLPRGVQSESGEVAWSHDRP